MPQCFKPRAAGREAQAQACGGGGLCPRGRHSRPAGMRLAQPGPRLAQPGPRRVRSYAGPAGLREGRGGARGGAGGREGRGRGLLARAAEASRAVAPARRPCAASATDGGGGAGARGPARAPGAARSAREPPAGRNPGPEGEASGLGREQGRGEAAPAPRGGRGSRRPPRRVSLSASPPGCPAVRLGAPQPPRRPSRLAPTEASAASVSPPLPIPGRAPPASQAHAFGPASARSPPPTRLLRDPGARLGCPRPCWGAGGRSPVARERGWKYAGLSPRTPEDITPAGGWRR